MLGSPRRKSFDKWHDATFGTPSYSTDLIGMEDPLKAAETHLVSETDKTPLATRRLSAEDHGSLLLSTMDLKQEHRPPMTTGEEIVPKIEQMDTPMSGYNASASALHPHDYVHSAPILNHQFPMSSQWHVPTMAMPSAAIYALPTTHMPPSVEHRAPTITQQQTSYPSVGAHTQFDWRQRAPTSAGVGQDMFEDPRMAAPMSAPIRPATGTYGSSVFGGENGMGLKRKLPEPDFSGAVALGMPSPKKPKALITPDGTPHRSTHTPNMWIPTPGSIGDVNGAIPPPIMSINSGSSPVQALPPSFGLMPFSFAPGSGGTLSYAPPGASFIGSAGYALSGYPPTIWPGAYSSMESAAYGQPILSGDSRRRRKGRSRTSQLVPKVTRPSKGGSDKWKDLSKKERERARRAELKQCYNDLSNCLSMEAQRSGAQLPDRADIVRGACEEIRRLERTLAALQGTTTQSDAIKEDVKHSIQ